MNGVDRRSASDPTSRQLAEYAHDLGWNDLDAVAVHEVKRHLFDALGCAIGGRDSEPARISRRVATRTHSDPSASLFFTEQRSSPELATFANTVSLRYLDYNDTFIGKGGLHPSDVIPALLAVAEEQGASGRELIASIAVAYEILGSLVTQLTIRERGWDQGTFIVLAVAMAAGRLLALDVARLEQAASIAITSNISTRQTRVGELAMWKGCATAAAAKSGVFAATLAAEGMTGPVQPFEGPHGIKALVTGPFELRMPADERTAVELSSLKYYPSEYHSQAPLGLLERLRRDLDPSEIERVHIDTYWVAYSEIGSEPAKWDPSSRETADHSLPFLVATMLHQGHLSMSAFSPESIADPLVRELMRRVTVSEDKGYTEMYPGNIRSRITISMRSGRTISEETDFPRGHPRNPMTDAEVELKFSHLCSGAVSPETIGAIREAVWELDALPTVDRLMRQLATA